MARAMTTGQASEAARSPDVRFVADVNVGKLARRLRMMGYDTRFERETADADLVRWAVVDDRVLLTRDRGIARRHIAYYGPLRVLLLRDDSVEAQLRQAVAAFGLSAARAFTLCLECDAPLAPLSYSDAARRVPPRVHRTQTRFMECPACRRIYWRGSHWAAMLHEMARVAGGAE